MFRSEHWVVIKGKATIFLDNKKFILKENESTFIPKKSKHRLVNNENKMLEIIEVQTGNNLSESDIKRFDDVYGRKSK